MKLNQQTISSELGKDFPGNVVIESVVSSTQEMAKQADQTSLQAFLAERQTSGYGKKARSFYSPSETGLYLSVLLPNIEKGEMNKAGLFTTGLADQIAKLLEEYYPEKKLGVKWVNDVMLDDAKVGGILVEAQIQGNSVSWIVGVGLNLCTADFPDDIDRTVGSLDSKKIIDRNKLAADLIKTIWHLKSTYQSGDFLSDYRKRLVLTGKTVTLKLAQENITGIVKGINNDGQLLIELDNGEIETFNEGEVIKVQY